MPFADPNQMHPIVAENGAPFKQTVFLKPAINHPQFEVGSYTYASAFDVPEDWAACLAPYLFDFSPERLIIGKFCQIADGVTFITGSANHRYDGISSFPFAIFDDGSTAGRPSMPDPGGDTIIGHDVWIGQGATVLPGAQIGNGVIVGARSVVGGTLPDYSIVVGNPARVVRQRFEPSEIARINEVAWWDWPIDMILEYEALIMAEDITALEAVASLGAG
ncbi:MAG: CatB-related O-acetyltransferase [Sulfitobacter sp.]